MVRDLIRSAVGAVGLLDPIRRYRAGRNLERRRQAQAARFPGINRSTLAPLLGNSMAKSGSHILSQFLLGLEQLTPLVNTNWKPIRTLTRQGLPRSHDEILGRLEQLEGGDIAWGYLPSELEYLAWFRQAGARCFFVYRDPRDKIVSHILYALNIHEDHAMHDYYAKLENMEQRINETIVGVPGMVEPVRKTYQSYWGWLEEPGVLPLRFEDLVNKRERTLAAMLDFLQAAGVPFSVGREEAYRVLNQAMAPEHSPTFRSGKSGEWRRHFSVDNIERFRRETGDLLEKLGYSED